MRGTKEGLELFKLWHDELKEKSEKGIGPWKDGEEKYRVMWDGIACWPYLGDTYKVLKKIRNQYGYIYLSGFLVYRIRGK